MCDGEPIDGISFENRKLTRLVVSKLDESGKLLPGAVLELADSNGNVVESWTSTNSPHETAWLEDGAYELRETAAPTGYMVADAIAIETLCGNAMAGVIMLDDGQVTMVDKKVRQDDAAAVIAATGDGAFLIGTLAVAVTTAGIIVLAAYRRRNS